MSPNHFAAQHYLTHAHENGRRPGDALPRAAAYAKLAPGVPHALHMHGHVLRQLGRVDEAVHCVNCRKLTAASVATYVHVEKDKFRWLAGEDNINAFENRRRAAFASSAGPAARWFRAKPPISRR